VIVPAGPARQKLPPGEDLADLFSVLPHDDMVEMMELLSKEDAALIRTIISEREASAHALMSTDFAAFPKEVKAEEVLRELKRERDAISYVYVVGLRVYLVVILALILLKFFRDFALLPARAPSPPAVQQPVHEDFTPAEKPAES
jgi:Mg/Co/Ni transporter MgtE